MKPHNIFSSIPHHLDKELFECLLTRHVTIERIISKGHRSAESDWYDQENEWVMVLKGKAVLSLKINRQYSSMKEISLI